MFRPGGMKAVEEVKVTIRFYEELNDFLKGHEPKRDIVHRYYGKRSVKDIVESFGVPHAEVDMILINGESAGFDHIAEDGDRISVYPMFETLNIEGLCRLRDFPLREPRFVLDVHLGKLARRLRLLGFDVRYRNDLDDDEIVGISNSENRTILTFDRRMLMRNAVQRGMIVRSRNPFGQVVEVLDRLDLWDAVKPFGRCIECNGRIHEIIDGPEYRRAFGELPHKVKTWCRELYLCDACGRVYWKGSHYEAMMRFIDMVFENRATPEE